MTKKLDYAPIIMYDINVRTLGMRFGIIDRERANVNCIRIVFIESAREPRASIAERGDSILSQPVKRLLGHPFTTRNNSLTHCSLTSFTNLHTEILLRITDQNTLR